MAKTGGAVQKLQDKAKRNATTFRMGKFKPMIARVPSTYAEKVVALAAHKRAIHGHWVNGVCVEAGGRNPGPADTFRGDGLPDDSLAAVKAPKSNAERAEKDKREPLKSEWRDGFRPQAWRGRRWS